MHDENNDVIDFVQFDRWFGIKVYSKRIERKKIMDSDEELHTLKWKKKINSIQKNLWIPMIHRTLCARKFCGLTGLRVEVDSSLNVTKCSMKFRRNLNSFSRVLFRKTKTKSKTTPNQDKGNEVKSNCEFDSAIMITQTSKILILSFLIKLNLVG